MISSLYFAMFACFGFSTSRRLLNQIIASLLLGIYGLIISISRLDITTGDLPNYVAGFSQSVWNTYYLREPLFWFVGRSINFIVSDPAFIFAAMDAMLLLLIRKSFKGKFGISIAFLTMTFPFVLGFTNIYRQLFASILLIKAFSDEINGRKPFNFYFILAALTHLSVIPAIICYYFVKLFKTKPIPALLIFCLLLGSFIYYEVIKIVITFYGGTPTRSNTSFLYILMFYSLSLVTFLKMKKVTTATSDLFFSIILFSIIGVILLMVAPASSGTRILMISILLQSFIFLSIQNQGSAGRRQSFLMTFGFLFITIIPSIISPSAWHLLWGHKL